VTTIQQLNKPCIFLLFMAKKDLGNFVLMTDSAQLGTWFPTKPDAWVVVKTRASW